MTKKDKKGTSIDSKNRTESPISRRGWRIVGMGGVLVVLGYIVLSLTDPRGQNWASHISPFLLLGGYATIGFGILAKDLSTKN